MLKQLNILLKNNWINVNHKKYIWKKIVGDLHFLKEYVHLLCTSEDINNLSYSLMIKESKDNLILQEIHTIVQKMANFSETVILSKNKINSLILSRTHG
jgi:adenylosuccinate lyase